MARSALMQSPGAHASTRNSGPSVARHCGMFTARSSTMPNGLDCSLLIQNRTLPVARSLS